MPCTSRCTTWPAAMAEVGAGQIWVHCQSGYRASLAAGLLDAAGRDVVLIDDDFGNAERAGLTESGAVPGPLARCGNLRRGRRIHPVGTHSQGAEMPVRRLNHAVLYVRDLAASVAFYREAFGFEVRMEIPGQAAFLRAQGTANDHDLGLFAVPDGAPQEGRYLGLYHLAWEVGTLAELAETRAKLVERGALVGASDHRVSKSLYAKDPSGIEFEVMWRVPAGPVGARARRRGHDRAAGPGRRDRALGRPGDRRRGRLDHLTPADPGPAAADRGRSPSRGLRARDRPDLDAALVRHALDPHDGRARRQFAWPGVTGRRDSGPAEFDPDTRRQQDLGPRLVRDGGDGRLRRRQLGRSQIEQPAALVDDREEPPGQRPAPDPADRALQRDREPAWLAAGGRGDQQRRCRRWQVGGQGVQLRRSSWRSARA